MYTNESIEIVYQAYRAYVADHYPNGRPADYDDLLMYYRENNKVGAIKAVREASRTVTDVDVPVIGGDKGPYIERARLEWLNSHSASMGLKDSKDWVDALWAVFSHNYSQNF